MNRKGYVSLEVIVIAGIALAAGIVLLVSFIGSAEGAASDSLGELYELDMFDDPDA